MGKQKSWKACIVRTPKGNKFFGKALKFNTAKKAYLVEVHKTKVVQWVPEGLVETKTHIGGIVK